MVKRKSATGGAGQKSSSNENTSTKGGSRERSSGGSSSSSDGKRTGVVGGLLPLVMIVLASVLFFKRENWAREDSLMRRLLPESLLSSSPTSSPLGTGLPTDPSVYLSPHHAVPGFHVATLSNKGAAVGKMMATVHLYGLRSNDSSSLLHFEVPVDSFGALYAALGEELKLDEAGPSPPTKYPWAMYNGDGSAKLDSLEKVMETPVLLIFKGGEFIWPGIEEGHVTEVKGLAGLGSIRMTTLSLKPLVFEMENFLTDDECAHIIERASPNLAPSPVTLMDNDLGKSDDNWRTSQNTFLPSKGDDKLVAVDQRVEDLTRVSKLHQESVQVLRYRDGQRYSAHHDFFNPVFYQKDANTLRSTDNGRRNRMITVFWYLSTVEKGGETIFPRSGGVKGRVDFDSCETGLKVKPVKGKVAMFYSMTPDGQFDDFSLHGACPVIEGEKFAANKWVWSAPSAYTEYKKV